MILRRPEPRARVVVLAHRIVERFPKPDVAGFDFGHVPAKGDGVGYTQPTAPTKIAHNGSIVQCLFRRALRPLRLLRLD
jgi:hypothetical protein